MEFDGKWALVTGGGRGIGEAVALMLADRGANVAVAALEKEETEGVARKVSARGVKSLALQYDARDESSIAGMFADFDGKCGRLDIMVNNAGIYKALSPLALAGVEEFDELMAVNVRGTFLCSKQAVARMMEKGGVMVNVSSALGKKSLPAMGAYCASKAAINSLTRTLALECAPGIRVNAVCPGPVDTLMTREGFPKVAESLGMSVGELQEELMKAFPLKRVDAVEDVASLVVFLAGEGARNMTGQCINTAAGWLMEA